jgi:hypothetical protein
MAHWEEARPARKPNTKVREKGAEYENKSGKRKRRKRRVFISQCAYQNPRAGNERHIDMPIGSFPKATRPVTFAPSFLLSASP